MKVNLNVEVRNIVTGSPVQLPVESSEPLKEGEKPKTKPLMLHNVVVTALTNDDLSNQSTKDEDDKTKMERWILTKKIIDTGKDKKEPYTVELESTELTIIKDRITIFYGTIVVGWAITYLESGVIGKG